MVDVMKYGGLLLVIAVLCILCIQAAPGLGSALEDLIYAAETNEHMEKHAEAEAVVQAANCNPIKKLYNKWTGNQATVCQVGDKFGVYIEEKKSGSPITAFIRDQAENAGQVIEYLWKGGYR